jgi:hypothetical protein
MEKSEGAYFEKNSYESYVKVQEIIQDKINSCSSSDQKLAILLSIIDIFENLENYIYSDDEANLLYVAKILGINFNNLVSELLGNYLLSLESELRLTVENSEQLQEAKAGELIVETVISSAIEQTLKESNVEFSTKLDRTQIEYLVRNQSEYNNLIIILETIGRIKMLPSVAGKNLNI